MAHRSTDVKEELAQKALIAIVPGVIGVAIGGLMVFYEGMFVILGYLLLAGGLGAIGFGVFQLMQMRKVADVAVECPFCKKKNHLTEAALTDVRCTECLRMIPIEDGRILRVFQVRCGFCNHLNFYNERSTGLICEECNRVVPISTDEGTKAKAMFDTYTQRDDTNVYDLVLTGRGAGGENLINCLQHMLALNRNQVKDLLEETPVVLLQGIPRKKAELLKTQIEVNEGQADFKVSGT